MSALSARPGLRALVKLPSNIQLPKPEDFGLPPGMHWSASSPPKPGFERFFNPTIRSMLTLPSQWYGYEFAQDFQNGIIAQNVLSAVEDVAEKGCFDTGVTFTVIKITDLNMAKSVAEAMRLSTLNEIATKIGGSTDWIEYGDTAKICSLRYVSNVPEVKFHTGAIAPAKSMIFIQDLFVENESGLIFRMKYECPKELFDVAKSDFEAVKTGGYFVVDDTGSNGIAFVQL